MLNAFNAKYALNFVFIIERKEEDKVEDQIRYRQPSIHEQGRSAQVEPSLHNYLDLDDMESAHVNLD